MTSKKKRRSDPNHPYTVACARLISLIIDSPLRQNLDDYTVSTGLNRVYDLQFGDSIDIDFTGPDFMKTTINVLRQADGFVAGVRWCMPAYVDFVESKNAVTMTRFMSSVARLANKLDLKVRS